MAKSDKATRLDRRDFLKFAGAGAVGGAALAASGAANATEQTDAVEDGYRETKHVKTFYDLARF